MRVFDDWILTPERVAVHVPSATAVAADLHLGYCEARRRRGDAVPTPVLADLLQPLGRVLGRYQLRRLVVAGDLFEDGVDEKLGGAFLAWLRGCGAELVGVVPGNHDRRLKDGAAGIPVFGDGLWLEEWLVVHGDRPLPKGPVVFGHFHPSLHAAGKSWPCYMVAARRIVLPAFSADARGGGAAAWRGYRRLVPAGPDVLDFGVAGAQQNRKPARARRRLPG